MNPPESAVPRKRRRARWIVLGVIGVIFVSLGGIYVDAWTAADQHLRLEREAIASRLEALRTRRVLRPVFFEPEEEGNSWELVGPAIEEPAPARDASSPAFARLKRGLSRSWTEPFSSTDGLELTSSGPNERMCDHFVFLANHEYKAGRTGDAVELLAMAWGVADRMAVKRDFLGLFHHYVGACRGLASLRDFLMHGGLWSADLQRLAGLLELIDRHPADLAECFRIEDLKFRRDLLETVAGRSESQASLLAPKLRNLSSRTIEASRLLRLQDEYLRGFEAVFNLSGRRRSKALGELQFRVFETESYELYMRLSNDQSESTLSVEAEHSIALPLSRVAVALARHARDEGRFPKDLGDLVPSYLPSIPMDGCLGLPLRYLMAGNEAKVYACGFDGDDDGGREADEIEFDRDIVWTVKVAP